MLVLLELELELELELQVERSLAAGADHEESHPMLRHAKVGAIHNMWGQRIAQTLHRICPGRVQNPVHELRDVLDDCKVGPIHFSVGHRSPGRRA